jgi:hypothetical protein
MEHQTGPDGPAETEEAEQAATVHGGVPESTPAAHDAQLMAAEPEPRPEWVGEAPAERAAGRDERIAVEDSIRVRVAEREVQPESEVGADPAAEPAAERAREPQPVPTTGEPRVDAALKLLDRLPDLAVNEHSEVFEQVHAKLADVLGELDSRPAGPAGG